MTKQELLDKADFYKSKINENRLSNSEQLKELDDYFRVGVTYNSNAIEGNTLTITETKNLIENGIAVGGKPIKDHYEVAGHAETYDYMLTQARSGKFDITEDTIKQLHYLFYNKIDLQEAGQYRKMQVGITGTEYQPPAPEDVPHLMTHFINQMESSKRLMHPIEFAAMCYKRLVDIHPFKDGNGQTARLLMNLLLVNEGYGVTSIPTVLRNEYNNALIAAQSKSNPDIDPLISFIAECVIDAETDHCRLLRINLVNFETV